MLCVDVHITQPQILLPFGQKVDQHKKESTICVQKKLKYYSLLLERLLKDLERLYAKLVLKSIHLLTLL